MIDYVLAAETSIFVSGRPAVLIRAVYGDLLKMPYAVASEVVKMEEVIEINVNVKTELHRVVSAVLLQHGIFAEWSGGFFLFRDAKQGMFGASMPFSGAVLFVNGSSLIDGKQDYAIKASYPDGRLVDIRYEQLKALGYLLEKSSTCLYALKQMGQHLAWVTCLPVFDDNVASQFSIRSNEWKSEVSPKN